MKIFKKHRGFTLIEILIVIGIIAILASIVIIAINPAKQFAQARNTQRQSNVEALLNAVGQRMSDNKGIFQGTYGVYTCPTLPSTESPIFYFKDGLGTESVPSGSNGVNLSCLSPTYISLFPTDPSSATGDNTGYTIYADSSSRVHICAPAAALETSVPGSTTICLVR